jgi:ribonuclease Z
MTDLIILGTANAIADARHENTHMAVRGELGVVLVDCVGTPTVRLAQAGIGLDDIADIILTHFHPDHVSGVPLLLMSMWLSGRTKPLRIYGLHHCLNRLEDMMAAYEWGNWPRFFPISFHRLPERENVLVLERPDFRILASPVRHMIPTIGLRFEASGSGRSVAYSSDTEPCAEVVRLASGAEVLIHEASGAEVGHTSPAGAGEIAAQAEVGRLLLIHYPTRDMQPDIWREEAADAFQGKVDLASDMMVLPL